MLTRFLRAPRALAALCVCTLAAGPAGAELTETEANDSLATANDVALAGDLADAYPPGGAGALVRGGIAPGDVDYFSFGVRTGERVTVTVSEPGGGAFHDPALGIFDETGAPAGGDDDSGPGFLPATSFTADADGNWTVAVTGFQDAAFDGSTHAETFAYTLEVSVETAPPSFPEAADAANDLPAGAEPIPPGAGLFETRAPGSVAVVSGALAPGDVDYYDVPVEGGARIGISVEDHENGAFGDAMVRLFDDGGNLVASDDDSGPGFVPSLTAPVDSSSTQPWRIAVAGFGDDGLDGSHDETLDYQLVVSLAGPDEDVCDVNQDGGVDVDDVDLIFAARGQPVGGGNAALDVDDDGQITVLDSRYCTLQCDNPNCAPSGGGSGQPKAGCGLGGPGVIAFALLLPILRKRARPAAEHEEL